MKKTETVAVTRDIEVCNFILTNKLDRLPLSTEDKPNLPACVNTMQWDHSTWLLTVVGSKGKKKI